MNELFNNSTSDIPEYLKEENAEKYKEQYDAIEPGVQSALHETMAYLRVLIGTDSEVYDAVMHVLNEKVLNGDYLDAYREKNTDGIHIYHGETADRVRVREETDQ